jgi:hypothetical protein
MRSGLLSFDQFLRLLARAIAFNWGTVIESKSIFDLQ